MENNVRYLSSMHPNSPNLTGRPGSLLEVLDGALITGYNEVDVVSVARVGAIATVVTAAPHGLDRGQCCRLSGSEDALYNGDFRIDSVVSATEFKITVDSNAQASAAGLKCRIAPLGWANPFREGFVSVYRSADPSSTQVYYQFNDDMSTSIGAAEAGVRMYEEMTSYNTGEFPTPTVGASALGRSIRKSDTSDTTRRHWIIVGNAKSFYLFTNPDDNANSLTSVIWGGARFSPYFFGDFIPVSSADRYTASIFAGKSTNVSWGAFNAYSYAYTAQDYTSCFAQVGSSTSYLSQWNGNGAGDIQRDLTGNITNVLGYTWGRQTTTDQVGMGMGTLINYPNGSDGSLLITPVIVIGSHNAGLRGRMPGAYDSYHGVIFDTLQTTEGVLALPNRILRAIRIRHGIQTGMVLIDLTGPWE